MNDQEYWKKCSACKKEVPFSSKYFVCSVSTCNGKRTGLVFCSVPCFETHLPGARHKEAFAFEETSPKKTSGTNAEIARPTRRIITKSSESITGTTSSNFNIPRDTLVVVSKLKDYVKARGDMNTSGSCMSALSDIIRRTCDDAIENARAEGRKTIMDRDFKK